VKLHKSQSLTRQALLILPPDGLVCRHGAAAGAREMRLWACGRRNHRGTRDRPPRVKRMKFKDIEISLHTATSVRYGGLSADVTVKVCRTSGCGRAVCCIRCADFLAVKPVPDGQYGPQPAMRAGRRSISHPFLHRTREMPTRTKRPPQFLQGRCH